MVRTILWTGLVIWTSFCNPCPLLGDEFQPFAGIVTGDNVNVRSGSDLNFEIIYKLNKDDKIVVIGKNFDWYRIRMPEGSFGYINKQFIDVMGEAGVIKGDKVNVRSGPDISTNPLGQLGDKAVVKVIKTVGDWYQIEPPDSCSAWVNSQYVKHYSSVEDYMVELDKNKEVKNKFSELEKNYEAAILESVPQASGIESLLKGYEELMQTHPDFPGIDKVKDRIEKLRLKIAEARYIETTSKMEAKLAELEKPKEETEPPLAVGVIEDLGMVLRRYGTHKLLEGKKVTHYLKSDNVDLNKYVYYTVKIWGTIQDAPKSDHPVILVDKVALAK